MQIHRTNSTINGKSLNSIIHYDFLMGIGAGFIEETLTSTMFSSIEQQKFLKEQKARILGRLRKATADKTNDQPRGILKSLARNDSLKAAMKRRLRAINICRGMVAGKSYREIEPYTREGNEPQFVDLMELVGSLFDAEEVFAWLTNEPAVEPSRPTEQEKVQKTAASYNKLLSSEDFLSKAPEDRIEEMRQYLFLRVAA